MAKGATLRVDRLVRAYELVYTEERHPLFAPKVSVARTEALRRRILALLPLLTPEETERYYARVRRWRELGH